ncbi:MAG TPA: serine/threonine-protein kinase [Kofleriaceae bacterium]|nr:serine/threonine-protein kinase [Kofleriaceae bacterium]
MKGYELGDVVGRGGMGQVHIARHRAGHLVVVKRVRNTLWSDQLIHARLSIESRLLRRVDHPNVVRALDAGEDADGAPYLVMDRAHGTPLGALIETTGPLPIARVSKLASQLLEGLGAIHDAGIVHADINASNIIVDDSDHLVIIDFGLARTSTSNAHDGVIAGTPAYMAPEVISGEVPTRAADIYAAGTILYEMLTGTPPFTGPIAAILTRQLADVVEPPSRRAPQLGQAGATVDDVVLRALARDPTERFSSAAALAGALAAALIPQAASAQLDLIELTATREFWSGDTRRVCIHHADAETITHALERVRTFVDGHDHESAIAVLEGALQALRARADDAEITPAAWRLESVLAALFDHRGRIDAALRTARAAYHHALRAQSEGAVLRTRELLTRLAGRPRMARGSRPFAFEGTRARRPSR